MEERGGKLTITWGFQKHVTLTHLDKAMTGIYPIVSI